MVPSKRDVTINLMLADCREDFYKELQQLEPPIVNDRGTSEWL